MIKFSSNHKIVFYFINFALIFLYLFPGSLIGQLLYGSKKIQPKILPGKRYKIINEIFIL